MGQEYMVGSRRRAGEEMERVFLKKEMERVSRIWYVSKK
jgi:hypothetical protein